MSEKTMTSNNAVANGVLITLLVLSIALLVTFAIMGFYPPLTLYLATTSAIATSTIQSLAIGLGCLTALVTGVLSLTLIGVNNGSKQQIAESKAAAEEYDLFGKELETALDEQKEMNAALKHFCTEQVAITANVVSSYQKLCAYMQDDSSSIDEATQRFIDEAHALDIPQAEQLMIQRAQIDADLHHHLSNYPQIPDKPQAAAAIVRLRNEWLHHHGETKELYKHYLEILYQCSQRNIY